MNVDTIIAVGVSAVATLAAAGYSVWRQQFREIALRLNLDLLPRLNVNLDRRVLLEEELDLDLVREVGRTAAIFGGEMRNLGEELFVYISMWKHPGDQNNLEFYPSHDRLEERTQRDWIARQIGYARREIAYRTYFDVQPFRHRVTGYLAERNRRQRAAEHDKPLREALKKRSPI